MGLLDSLVPALLERRQSIENPATPLSEWFGLLSGRKTKAGSRISEESAYQIAAVWRAVNVISQQVATIPIHVYRRLEAGGKERVPSNPVATLLRRQPNPYMTPAVFRETLQSHVLTWGNGYAEIERDQSARPRALWPITPDRVAVMIEELRRGGTIKWFVIQLPGGGFARVEAANMLHIPGPGFNGYAGRSVISMARESLGLTKAAEEFGSYFFGQGTRANGILEAPQGTKFNETTIRQLRESWAEINGGLENSHRIVILQDGMQWKQTSIPPNDSQFLETRQFQLAEVARWFGVNPHKLYDLSRSTFSNIEHQAIEFDTDTLLPWLTKWEEALNVVMFSERAKSQLFVEFLMDGILRADTKTRADFYERLNRMGAMTINEIRARENLNPIPGGDRPFVRRDTWPLDSIDVLVESERTPEPSQPTAEPGDGGERSAADAVYVDGSCPANSLPSLDISVVLVRREAERIVQREVDQVRKILNDSMKRQDVARFTGDIANFYVKHAEWAADRLSPILRDITSENLVELGEVLAEHKHQPGELEGAVRARLDEWLVTKPGTIARRVCQ